MRLHVILDIALFGAVVATAWYAKALRSLVGALTVRVTTLANDLLKDRAAFNRDLGNMARRLDISAWKVRHLEDQVLAKPHDAWAEAEEEMLADERKEGKA